MSKYNTINSIQKQTYLERLPVKTNNFRGVWGYDIDNLYPNKIRTMQQRSPFAYSASETMGDFILGNIVEYENMFVNDDDTMQDLLFNLSQDYALFNGFAILLNYNQLGEISSLEHIPFEWVRYKSDLTCFKICNNWGDYYAKDTIKYNINLYSPETALQEIEMVGAENYSGQLFYFTNSSADLYPVARIDSALDAIQFDSQRNIYSLNNIQTDYSVGGILNIPAVGTDENQINDLINGINNDLGAVNSGGLRAVISNNPEVEYKFTPISRNDIDKLFTNQYQQCVDSIFATYRMPKILAGIESQGMFNQQQYQEATDYFNKQTQRERKRFELNVNKVLENSIFPTITLDPK